MTYGDLQAQLDRLRESANDSARSFRTTYTFYLVVAFYILAIASTTDHELLFRDGEVELPVINVSVSVKVFFIFAPSILFLLHLNLLIQGIFLSRKITQYVFEVNKNLRSGYEKTVVLGLMFPVSLALKIMNADQRWSIKILLNMIVFISLILLSPGILIYTQIQFLPYQDNIIWLHRLIVLADLVLLWLLWPQIAAPSKTWRKWLQGSRPTPAVVIRGRWKSYITDPLHLVFANLAIVVTLIFLFFAFVIADFPGGSMSMWLPQKELEIIRNLQSLERKYNLSDRILVSEEPSPEILSVYYRTSCKPDDIYGSNSCDESTIEIGSPFWCKHAKPLQLKNRRIRNANLSNTILCGAVFENGNLYDVDMSGSNLLGAQLTNVDLRGARLGRADLRGARLGRADLRGARLGRADLRGARLGRADLRGAYLQGTNFRDAQLWGTDLRNIQLEEYLEWFPSLLPPDLRGANLSGSNLSGVNLSGTLLHGADLLWSDLPGINLSGSELHGANLSEARLHGANLSKARLHGSNLSETILSGANLSGADLRGANLSGAKLHGVDLSEANLSGADLRGSELVGAQFVETKLDLADLRNINLSIKPSNDIIQEIEKISNEDIRRNALKRIHNAINQNTKIEELSLNDAILCKMENLYTKLKNSSASKLSNQDLHIINCETETEPQNYFIQLANYFSDLICSDESSHIAKKVFDRFYDNRFGPKFAIDILSDKCPEQ